MVRPSTEINDSELDIGKYLRLIFLFWRYPFGLGALGLVIGYRIFSTSPSVWEGQFEIYTKDQTPPIASLLGSQRVQNSLIDPALGNLANNVDTQIYLLQSPYVLSRVYNRLLNNQLTSNYVKTPLIDWKTALKVKLVQGTSILQVTYRSTDRSSIIPVLDTLSDEYRNYSKLDKTKSLQAAEKYLLKQLSKYRPLSLIYTDRLERFKLLHGISGSQISLSSPKVLQPNTPDSAGNTPSARTNQPVDLNLSPASDSLGQLAYINRELIRRRKIFTDNDPVIGNLLLERDSLQTYLKSSANGLIASPNSKNLTPAQAQEIASQFTDLYRKASLYTEVVSSLDSSLTNVRLSIEQTPDSWDVISNPRTNPNPVEPRWLRVIGASVLLGTLLGSVASLIHAICSNRVYFDSDFELILKVPILATSVVARASNTQSLITYISEYAIRHNFNLAIIPIDLDITDDRYSCFVENLKSIFLSNNVLIGVQSSLNFSPNYYNLIIAGLGMAKFESIKAIGRQISLNQHCNAGIILFST
mgnify:CR=1 FL=1